MLKPVQHDKCKSHYNFFKTLYGKMKEIYILNDLLQLL